MSELTPTNKLVVPPKDPFSLPAMPGLALEPDSKLRPLPENGQVFVEMNSAGHIRVPRDRIGQIFTTALAGCTGIAAIARTEGDTLAGISHFDAIVDGHPAQRTEGMCASQSFMNMFTKIGRFIGAQHIEFHVAYASMHEQEAAHGKRGADFSQWHFLDQLGTFADRNNDVTVTMQSYEGMSASHTLAANVDLDGQTNIDFI